MAISYQMRAAVCNGNVVVVRLVEWSSGGGVVSWVVNWVMVRLVEWLVE